MSVVGRFSGRGRQVATGDQARGRMHVPRPMLVGGVIIAGFIAAAIVSLFWTPYPPSQPATGTFLGAPSWSHLFGTNSVGGDVFSQALAATRTDVGITVAVIAIAFAVGTLWGTLSGFIGGAFDAVTIRVLQVINAFPALLLAMLVISALGRSIIDVIVVVALIPLPDYVRLSRAEVRTRKQWPFAEAAQMIGRRPMGVLFGHIVPNSLRPAIAYAAINASWVVATVGALGFLGLGIQPGSAEWGSMIAGGESGISSGQWWMSFFPGLAIFVLALAFHLIGDCLSDADVDRQS